MFSVRCVHQYDLRNRLTLSCGARGSCTGYQYDPDDNLTQATSGIGTVTQYQYDNLNRRSEIDYGVVSGNPTSKVTLTYDLGDRLTQAVDSNSNGTVTRQYGSGFDLANGWDFVTKETTSQGSVSYGEPDVAGRRTTMTVTAGTTAEPTVTFAFDDAGKLTSVTRSGLTATKTFNDPAGRLKTLKLPNNLAVTYGYDKDSHVTSLSYGSLGTLNYGYDADGRRVSVSGSLGQLAGSAAHPELLVQPRQLAQDRRRERGDQRQ
jgi:YD repeat-containing protein